jgi:hypothetical protein
LDTTQQRFTTRNPTRTERLASGGDIHSCSPTLAANNGPRARIDRRKRVKRDAELATALRSPHIEPNAEELGLSKIFIGVFGLAFFFIPTAYP